MRAKSRSGRPKRSAPHPIDIHVGSRLRERRIELGMSQPELAAALGIMFQQLYKYEKAKNRISASRLYEMSKALGVPVTFFSRASQGSTRRRRRPVGGPKADERSSVLYRASSVVSPVRAAFCSCYVSLKPFNKKKRRSGDKAALRGRLRAQNGYFPEDGREPTRRRPTVNVRGVLLSVNAACVRRAAAHEPRWSVASTVRQLNEPKISHFDQLGCSRIGRKTARKSSTVK
jgi:transcriptional regulator with XRE-family HTH domain